MGYGLNVTQTISLPFKGNWIPLANLKIVNTCPHDYQSDSPGSEKGYGIGLISLGNKTLGNKNIKSYSIWVLNNENQELTVQPITTTGVIFKEQYCAMNTLTCCSPLINLIPTMPVGNSFIVDPGQAMIFSYKFDETSVEYISLQLKYSLQPTTDAGVGIPLPMGVYAVLFVYYE